MNYNIKEEIFHLKFKKREIIINFSKLKLISIQKNIMTDLLNTYEKSFRKNKDIIKTNFNKIDLSLSSSTEDSENQRTKINKAYLLDEIDKLIEEQQKILKQMEIEICSLINRDDYEEFSSKLSSFKKDLAIDKKKYNELYLKEDTKSNSYDNILLNENNNDNIFNKERYMLETNEKLQQVQRSLSNTESIGTNIIVNMDNQTKNMKNISGKLNNMKSDLNDSSNILQKMKNRAKKNKYIIIIFSIFLLLILFSFIGVKIYNKFK